eukprot:25148-Hanusia_phi.AAC.1
MLLAFALVYTPPPLLSSHLLSSNLLCPPGPLLHSLPAAAERADQSAGMRPDFAEKAMREEGERRAEEARLGEAKESTGEQSRAEER